MVFGTELEDAMDGARKKNLVVDGGVGSEYHERGNRWRGARVNPQLPDFSLYTQRDLL
jgi:hypothetical protein